jgi:hypothetical protein
MDQRHNLSENNQDPGPNILKITQWMTDHSKTTWRPSQNTSTIPRITLWMTDQSHTKWNSSHIVQMTQKLQLFIEYLPGTPGTGQLFMYTFPRSHYDSDL